MKKIVPLILIAIVLVLVYFSSRSSQDEVQTGVSSEVTQALSDQRQAEDSNASLGNISSGEGTTTVKLDDVKPAVEEYNNVEEALNAIHNGATNYDDAILEQFAEIGEDCGWCAELYEKLQGEMLDKGISEDERSYYAEILSLSGRPDNIQALITATKEAKDEDDAGLYLEALSSTVGNDETVNFLKSQLNDSTGDLKESLVAAITNHGSLLAVDALYQETVKSGDPDGYYSSGIGLGEVIPDEESLSYLQEMASKNDKYSHLAVKALLNYGSDGLRLVVDVLNNIPAGEQKEKILQDAIDHVSYEDACKDYAEELLKTSKDPVITKFAQDIINDFGEEDEDDDEEEDTGDDEGDEE